MFGRRKQSVAVPEVGGEAPEFNLPSAQGGQLRLSMRTVRGPVAVVFYRPWSDEDIEYFGALAGKEDEINMAGGSVVGIGVSEAVAAREFARSSGIKSYVLYDYAKVASGQWGLLERSKDHGDYSRPAVFVVDGDHNVANAWIGDRPSAEDVLAAISGITGLPRPADEEPRPKEPTEPGKKSEASPGEAKKLTAEEREKIKAERRAAREAGKPVRAGEPTDEAAKKPDAEKPDAKKDGGDSSDAATEAAQPKKMSAEEREKIKAERRAAREAGKSLKTPKQTGAAPSEGGEGEKSGPEETSGRPDQGAAQAESETDAGTGAGTEAGDPAVSSDDAGVDDEKPEEKD